MQPDFALTDNKPMTIQIGCCGHIVLNHFCFTPPLIRENKRMIEPKTELTNKKVVDLYPRILLIRGSEQ